MDSTRYESQAPATIQQLFGQIAKRYDLTNSLLSFGLHRVWNRRLAQKILERTPTCVVDLCCGTGEIARAFLTQSQRTSVQITCVDFCPSMLALATDKLAPWAARGHQLTYVVADVQQLPLPDGLFDAATMAYGIRNVASPDLALQEAHRVLRDGGQLAILELTRPRSAILKFFHRGYTRWGIPLLGSLTTSSRAAYCYLGQSIQGFLDPVDLAKRMETAGFGDVEIVPLLGGAATLLVGTKGSVPSAKDS